MQTVSLRHEIHCNEDVFWDKCVFSEDFNQKLYLEALKFPAYRVVSQREEGGNLIRELHIEPALAGLPAPVQKLIGDKLSYTERGTWNRETRKYAFQVIPSTLSDKTRIQGELHCEPAGEGKIVRATEITVDVKVFMVGGMVEEAIARDLRAAYDTSAAFTNRFLQEHNLAT